MFAIAFDLVVAAAAEHHPRGVTAAYTDIGATLKKFNFERIQGSVYVCDNNAWRISSPRCWRSKRCRGSRRWSGTSVASASRTGAISRPSSKSLQVPDAAIAAFQTERMGVTLTKQRVGRSSRVPRPASPQGTVLLLTSSHQPWQTRCVLQGRAAAGRRRRHAGRVCSRLPESASGGDGEAVTP